MSQSKRVRNSYFLDAKGFKDEVWFMIDAFRAMNVIEDAVLKNEPKTLTVSRNAPVTLGKREIKTLRAEYKRRLLALSSYFARSIAFASANGPITLGTDGLPIANPSNRAASLAYLTDWAFEYFAKSNLGNGVGAILTSGNLSENPKFVIPDDWLPASKVQNNTASEDRNYAASWDPIYTQFAVGDAGVVRTYVEGVIRDNVLLTYVRDPKLVVRRIQELNHRTNGKLTAGLFRLVLNASDVVSKNGRFEADQALLQLLEHVDEKVLNGTPIAVQAEDQGQEKATLGNYLAQVKCTKEDFCFKSDGTVSSLYALHLKSRAQIGSSELRRVEGTDALYKDIASGKKKSDTINHEVRQELWELAEAIAYVNAFYSRYRSQGKPKKKR